MVGRIEKALNKNALTPDNPLTLTQVAADPDIITFKLPIDYDLVASVGLARFSLDDECGGELQKSKPDPSDNSTLLIWKATYDMPGQHLLQPQFYLKNIDFSSGTQPETKVDGPFLPVTTHSVLKFDSFYADFDDGGDTIYAALAYLNATYSIAIQDPATPSGPPITTMTGSTTTGEILRTWDLTDDRSGNLFTGDTVNTVITVTPTSLPAETHQQEQGRVGKGFGDGDFTVTFSWADSAPGGAFRRCIQKGVVDPLISTDTSGPMNPNPYPHTFNDFSTFYTPGVPGFIPSSSEMNTLLNNLSSATGQSGNYTRNFYWQGHGSATTLGGQYGPEVHVFDVGYRLGNLLETSAGITPTVLFS